MAGTKKMYAWTDIKYTTRTGSKANNDEKTIGHVLKCGNEANQTKMGLTDQQWEGLVTAKAVRPVPYPVPLNTVNPISPVTHFRRIAKAIETGVDDPSLLESVLPPIQDNEPSKPDPTKIAAAESA